MKEKLTKTITFVVEVSSVGFFKRITLLRVRVTKEAPNVCSGSSLDRTVVAALCGRYAEYCFSVLFKTVPQF